MTRKRLYSLEGEVAGVPPDDERRVATANSPIPYRPPLEDSRLPDAGRIAFEITRAFG